MGVFNIFRRKTENSHESSDAKIKFDSRGEGIEYSLSDKKLWVGCDSRQPKVYSENIRKWENGLLLTDEEKKKVFSDILRFLNRKRKNPVIIINTDDPSRLLWEQLCSTDQALIESIEYTSNEEHFQQERQMWIDFINHGKAVVIDGIECRSVPELDEALRKSRDKPAV